MPCSTITKLDKTINFKIYKKELPNSARRALIESTKSSTFGIAPTEFYEYETNAYLYKKYVESVYTEINFFGNEPCIYYHYPSSAPVSVDYENCFIMEEKEENFCPRCTILSNLFKSPVISIDTKTDFWNSYPCHADNIPDHLYDCTSTDDDCFVFFKHDTEKYCYRCTNLLKSDSVNTECIDQSPTYISVLYSKKGGKRDGSTWRRNRINARPSRVDIKKKNKYHHESLSFF